MQFRRHSLITLVFGEEIVAKRSDWIVEYHRQMRNRFLGVAQQCEQRLDHANRGLRVVSRRRPVIRTMRIMSPIELVGSVDEMETHVATIVMDQRDFILDE